MFLASKTLLMWKPVQFNLVLITNEAILNYIYMKNDWVGTKDINMRTICYYSLKACIL